MAGRFVQFDALEIGALSLIIVIWPLFAVIFFLGRRGAAPKAKTVRRNTASRTGFVLQMIAYGIVFTVERPYFTPILPMSKMFEAIVLGIASAVGMLSILLCYWAMRTLGKQWSLIARIVAGHQLIQQGPFAIVRNPIYLAMLGLLVQAGIVVSNWQATLVAALLFLLGTQIRIREEEKILREEFGVQFEDYARRVPAFIPGVF